MKRLAITLEQLADRQNLLLATWKATRGKRHRPAVARWLDGLDDNLADLSASILQGHSPVGGLRRFTIQDPKPRTIGAHGLADRVLHHAILNLAEPRFEQMLVPSSYACRPGLGVHAAVGAAQHHLQRHAWWVQVDVASYFAHIDHALLRQLLRNRFKGEGFLALLDRIIDAGVAGLQTEAMRGAGLPVAGLTGAPAGLPIGALTSQHFANAYLDSADRFLLALPEVRAHVRYMDDIVWWCDGPHAEPALPATRLGRARVPAVMRIDFARRQAGAAQRWAGLEKPFSPTRAARRLVDQRRQELPVGQPQRQRAWQAQRERWLPFCPELQRHARWRPGVTEVDARRPVLDQMPRPASACRALRTGGRPNRKAPGVLVARWVEARRANAPRVAALVAGVWLSRHD